MWLLRTVAEIAIKKYTPAYMRQGAYMAVSKHAKRRLSKRCGLNIRSHDRMAAIALRDGLRHSDCTGRLKKYVDYLFLTHKKGNNIRLYGDDVYIFQGTTLITVLKLPAPHKNAVNKIADRKKQPVLEATDPVVCKLCASP